MAVLIFVFSSTGVSAQGVDRVVVIPFSSDSSMELLFLKANEIDEELEEAGLETLRHVPADEIVLAPTWSVGREAKEVESELKNVARGIAVLKLNESAQKLKALRRRVRPRYVDYHLSKDHRSIPLDLCLLESSLRIEKGDRDAAREGLLACRAQTYFSEPNRLLHNRAALELLREIDQALQGALTKGPFATNPRNKSCQIYVDGYIFESVKANGIPVGEHTVFAHCKDGEQAPIRMKFARGKVVFPLFGKSSRWFREKRDFVRSVNKIPPAQFLERVAQFQGDVTIAFLTTEDYQTFDLFLLNLEDKKQARIRFSSEDLPRLESAMQRFKDADLRRGRSLEDLRSTPALSFGLSLGVLAVSATALAVSLVLSSERKADGQLWAQTRFQLDMSEIFVERHAQYNNTTRTSAMWGLMVGGGLAGSLAGYLLATDRWAPPPAWMAYVSLGIAAGFTTWSLVEFAAAQNCPNYQSLPVGLHAERAEAINACVSQAFGRERGGFALASAFPFLTFGISALLFAETNENQVSVGMQPLMDGPGISGGIVTYFSRF